jgi:hypothetical protein
MKRTNHTGNGINRIDNLGRILQPLGRTRVNLAHVIDTFSVFRAKWIAGGYQTTVEEIQALRSDTPFSPHLMETSNGVFSHLQVSNENCSGRVEIRE